MGISLFKGDTAIFEQGYYLIKLYNGKVAKLTHVLNNKTAICRHRRQSRDKRAEVRLMDAQQLYYVLVGIKSLSSSPT